MQMSYPQEATASTSQFIFQAFFWEIDAIIDCLLVYVIGFLKNV